MPKKEKMYIDLIPANCIDRKAFFREFRVFRLRFSPSCEMKVEKLNQNMAKAYKKLNGSENISSLVYLSIYTQGGGGFCAVRKGKKEERSVKKLIKLFEDLDLTLPRELSDHSFCECSYTSSETETESTRFPDTVLLKLILNIAEREMYAPEKAVWPLYVYCGEGRNRKSDIVTMYLDVLDDNGYPFCFHSKKGYVISAKVKTFHKYGPGKNIPKYCEKNPYARCFTYDGSSRILGTSYDYKKDKNVYFEGPAVKNTKNTRDVFNKFDIDKFSYQKYGLLAELDGVLKGTPRSSFVSRFLPEFQFVSLPSRREGEGIGKREREVNEKIILSVKDGTFPLNIYGERIPEEVMADLEKDYNAKFSEGPVKGACNICILKAGVEEEDEESDRQYQKDMAGEIPVQHITLDTLIEDRKLNTRAFEICLSEEKIKNEIYTGSCEIAGWMKEKGLLPLTGKRTYALYRKSCEENEKSKILKESMVVDYDQMKIEKREKEESKDPAYAGGEFVIEAPGKADLIITETLIFGLPDFEELKREINRYKRGSGRILGELIEEIFNDPYVRKADPVLVDDILSSNRFTGKMQFKDLRYHKQLNGKLSDEFEETIWWKGRRGLKGRVSKTLERMTDGEMTLQLHLSGKNAKVLYPYFTDVHIVEDFSDMIFYYFVGSAEALNKTPRNIIARKCTIENGYELDEEEKEAEMKRAEAEILPLLYPMFVRSGQYTVLPMWAKYIRESMSRTHHLTPNGV